MNDRQPKKTDKLDFNDPNLLIGSTGEKITTSENRNTKQTSRHNHRPKRERSSPRPPRKRADYVRDFACLPDIVISSLWQRGDLRIFPATDKLDRLREDFKSVACWLAYYLLTKEELEEEFKVDYQSMESQLFHTELIYLKAEAELELATLNLIKEYRPKSLWAQTFDDSEQQWFRIAMSNCWRELSETNALGTGKPVYIGKKELTREARRAIKLFRTNNMVQRSPEGLPNIDWTHHLQTLFSDDAARVANNDDFFCKHYWEPYCDLHKSYWDLAEIDESMQLSVITESGQPFTTGDGKRFPSAKPKGFVPKRPRGRPPKGSRKYPNVKKY